VNPALLKVVIKVEEILIGKIQAECSTLAKLVVVVLVLFVGFYLYLLLYPIRIMDQEIAQTNGMVALVPKEAACPEQMSYGHQ
jgi:hypothetical protein